MLLMYLQQSKHILRLNTRDAYQQSTFLKFFAVLFLVRDRKSTRLNSSHDQISYAVFCLKKKTTFRTDPTWSPPLMDHAMSRLRLSILALLVLLLSRPATGPRQTKDHTIAALLQSDIHD